MEDWDSHMYTIDAMYKTDKYENGKEIQKKRGYMYTCS